WMGVSFALFGAVAALGTGNMIQANTTAHALAETLGADKIVVGLFLAFLTSLVIVGGIKRIAEVTTYLVPLMVVVYFVGALIVVVKNASHVVSGLWMIVEHAFSGTAATGGFAGATLAQTVRYGVARGLLSNESGLGSAPIAAAAAKTDQPAKQALVSMTGTFLDTLVVCTLTALVLSTTQAWVSGETGVALTLQAFSSELSGNWGKWIVTLGVVTFAFSTILAWEYYGEKCFEYLVGEKYIYFYRFLWILFVFVGAVVKLELVWNISDAMNALMAVPNLIGLVFLSGALSRGTQKFEEEIRNRADDKIN
ncbi:MAG: alanine/glycine:cation symporter family protein, partial [Nitrospinales bacterium]